MVVAYLTADRDKVTGIFQNPDAFVTAAPFLFLFAALIVLVFGPGKLSADALIGRLSLNRSSDRLPSAAEPSPIR